MQTSNLQTYGTWIIGGVVTLAGLLLWWMTGTING
jgi:hypothetical protein